MKVLCHLKRLQADVSILQESHLKEDYFYCMGKLGVGGSRVPLGGRRAGVLILIDAYSIGSRMLSQT